jgi:hypothetical protein
MSEFKSSNFTNEDNSGGPDLVGVTTFTSPYYFVPPSGTTAERPSGEGIAPGMLRFNTDIGRLEVWRGDHWATILGESPSLNGGARGLFGGGDSPQTDTIDFVTISTLGNAQDFGNLDANRLGPSGLGSRTRGVFGGAYGVNIIQFVTFASTGNATDFGDRTIAAGYPGAASNQTRGVFFTGYIASTSSASNVIDYITIASTGNAVDFGDATEEKFLSAGCSSSVRAIYAGARGTAPGYTTITGTIDYVTISTTGHSLDFGDLNQVRGAAGAVCSSIRGVFGGGYTPTVQDTIDFVTIASIGNAQDFGNLTNARRGVSGASSSTRGVFAGGFDPASTNIIDTIEIAATGNAVDFGDLTLARGVMGACSNGHGGL